METEILKPTVKKEHVLKYHLSWAPKNHWWADIYLEDWKPGAGRIMISSEWGSWSTSWGSMGCSIRDFILATGDDYIMMNLARYQLRWFDETATKNEIKKAILATRVAGVEKRKKLLGYDVYEYTMWDKEEAREVWDDMEEFFSDDLGTEDAYVNRVMYGDWKFMALFTDPPHPPLVTNHTPGLRNFMEHAWPRVKDILRSERDEEKNG